jgi:hypothetical protein
MLVVVWPTEDTTVELLTVRPVNTLEDAVTPGVAPMEKEPPEIAPVAVIAPAVSVSPTLPDVFRN